MFTIQKTDTGFTVTKGAGRPQPYFFNDARFVDIDGTNFSLVKCGPGHIIFNQPYTSVINGDTTEAFGSFSDLEAYINSYFFRKPGGGAGLTSQTLTDDVVIDIAENHLHISATADPANNLDFDTYDEGITSKSTDNTDPDHPNWSAWYQSTQHQRFFTQTPEADTYVFCEQDRVEIGYEDLDNVSRIKIDAQGAQIEDSINQLGLVDAADYSVNGKQNPLWKATWGAVTSLYDPGIATLVNGQVTVNSTLVKTISRQITLNYESVNGTLGILAALGADITDGESFIIKSLNPNGTVNTDDNSQIRYCVIGD